MSMIWEFNYGQKYRPNLIFLQSEVFLNEISMTFCSLDIITNPKACTTHSSAMLT